jgi:hypothetical protein
MVTMPDSGSICCCVSGSWNVIREPTKGAKTSLAAGSTWEIVNISLLGRHAVLVWLALAPWLFKHCRDPHTSLDCPISAPPA